MNIKSFVLNEGFKKLLDKSIDLESKIKTADPALENITVDERSYKKFLDYPGRLKITLIIFFITIVYMAFFSGAAVAIPDLLINNSPSNEIKSFSFVLSLLISGVISIFHIGFTLRGYYYGPVIHKSVNSIVFIFSLFICILQETFISDGVYFFSIMLCCLLIKLILNSQYYSDFIWTRMCLRINRVLFENELNKIKVFNKKQLREYSRVLKLEKRKKIRDKKRARHSEGK
ncbi:hypothetical protein [Xenorhabdus anantnagensis]|uniref:Uncharacterized protein n=1 Tax=Xenorhabdus anantnagensis TaxID=3025875 RepID=A0ABT5LT37_9GAMM|nr:hypothetical protein [Xenorhabdus anantnagensis]MDC9597567.1 hypothetical protein [Xenorhabdus anantnagensis]